MITPFRSLKARALLFLGLLCVCVIGVATFRAMERRDSDMKSALGRLEAHAQQIAEKQNDVIVFTQQFWR